MSGSIKKRSGSERRMERYRRRSKREMGHRRRCKREIKNEGIKKER